jgi:hypothetical protein
MDVLSYSETVNAPDCSGTPVVPTKSDCPTESSCGGPSQGARAAAIIILVIIVILFIGSICSYCTSNNSFGCKTEPWALVLSVIIYLIIIGIMIWSLYARNNVGLWVGAIFLAIVLILWIILVVCATAIFVGMSRSGHKTKSKDCDETDY